MNYTLSETKLKLKVHDLKRKNKLLRRRVEQYVILVELMQEFVDAAEQRASELNGCIDELIDTGNQLCADASRVYPHGGSVGYWQAQVARIAKEREG